MVEDVSDMLVKELPALVDSIQSEIGSNESDAFNSQVSEALSELNSSLATTKSGLQKALNAITGQSDAGFDTGEGGDEFDLGGEEGGDEFDLGGEGEEGMPGEEGDEEFSGFNAHGKTFDRSPEEPEPKALGRVGRKKR